MGQLVEVVFESVAPATAAALVRQIVAHSDGVLGIQVDGEDTESRAAADQLAVSAASWSGVRLATVKLGRLSIPNPSLRLLRTGAERFDVEFHLDLDDVEEPSAIPSALHAFAHDLAIRNSVANYFAGLEPAADEDTRLFTGESMGPLRFPD